jgi:hypothetical protein
LAAKRGACLWPCLSASEAKFFYLLQSVIQTNTTILQLALFLG